MFTSERRELCAAAVLLRLGLGVLMLVAGVSKFIMGLPAFYKSMEDTFGASWLPEILWRPFAYTIPFSEIVLGVLLIVGVARFWVAIVAALYMLGLAFGMQVIGKHDVVANNYMYFGLFVANVILGQWDRCFCGGWCRVCAKRQTDVTIANP